MTLTTVSPCARNDLGSDESDESDESAGPTP